MLKLHFNSQPHKEADAGSLRTGSQVRYFNSQPHKEADISSVLQSSPVEYFNSQPHKEADLIQQLLETPMFHFNSQPHKEADKLRLHSNCTGYNISTHSLIKRLTPVIAVRPISRNISTHSLIKRLTCIAHFANTRFNHFNSQPHKEADWPSVVSALSQ